MIMSFIHAQGRFILTTESIGAEKEGHKVSLSSNCLRVAVMSLTEGLGMQSERLVWRRRNQKFICDFILRGFVINGFKLAYYSEYFINKRHDTDSRIMGQGVEMLTRGALEP